MGWESSYLLRFDIWPLLQGQTSGAKLKGAYNSLIIGAKGLGLKPILNLLIGNHGLGISFKVKQG